MHVRFGTDTNRVELTKKVVDLDSSFFELFLLVIGSVIEQGTCKALLFQWYDSLQIASILSCNDGQPSAPIFDIALIKAIQREFWIVKRW